MAQIALALLAACERGVPPGEVSARMAAIARPNLVLIVVDTLRADWTTPYGFAESTSPEVGRWADLVVRQSGGGVTADTMAERVLYSPDEDVVLATVAGIDRYRRS